MSSPDVAALATRAVTLDTRGQYEDAVQAYVKAAEACMLAAQRECSHVFPALAECCAVLATRSCPFPLFTRCCAADMDASVRRVYEQKANEYAGRAEVLQNVVSARKAAAAAAPLPYAPTTTPAVAPAVIPAATAPVAPTRTSAAAEIIDATARATLAVGSAVGSTATRLDQQYDITGKMSRGLEYVLTLLLWYLRMAAVAVIASPVDT